MKKRKLNYRFHNPNTVEETAELLCKVFIDTNADKVDRAIRKDSEESTDGEYIAEHPV